MGNYLTEKEIVNIDSKIISNGIKNEIFASGFYLCNSISIEWYDLKEDEQDAFLEENACSLTSQFYCLFQVEELI